MRVEREMLALHAEVEIPLEAPLAPIVEPLRLGFRVDEELHLHLFELAHAIGEVARANLIAERLADLRNAKGQLLAHALLDVLEVDVDALRRLWPQIDQPGVLFERPHVCLEHQIELARRGERATLATGWANLGVATHLLHLVGAEAAL